MKRLSLLLLGLGLGCTDRELYIQPGDLIVAVNRTEIGSAEDASRALDYYAGRGPIRLICERDGQLFSTDFVIR